MALSQSQSFKRIYYLLMLRSFLIWTFTLTVCLLIIGFPLVILMVTIGSLAAVVLQSVMPFSGVLVVAGGILAINVLGILGGAAIMTIQGTHPQEVDWLRWLHSETNTDIATTSIYAACPLTCDIQRPA